MIVVTTLRGRRRAQPGRLVRAPSWIPRRRQPHRSPRRRRRGASSAAMSTLAAWPRAELVRRKRSLRAERCGSEALCDEWAFRVVHADDFVMCSTANGNLGRREMTFGISRHRACQTDRSGVGRDVVVLTCRVRDLLETRSSGARRGTAPVLLCRSRKCRTDHDASLSRGPSFGGAPRADVTGTSGASSWTTSSSAILSSSCRNGTEDDRTCSAPSRQEGHSAYSSPASGGGAKQLAETHAIDIQALPASHHRPPRIKPQLGRCGEQEFQSVTTSIPVCPSVEAWAPAFGAQRIKE